jgi:hypothetical protein
MVLTTTMMASHQQMTAREKDIYDTYSEDLERLTFNSKPVINSMTELANEYSSDFAHVIVRCIEDKIKIVSEFWQGLFSRVLRLEGFCQNNTP